MAYIFGNAQHIGGREQQQDAFGFSDPNDAALGRHGGFLAVVADGMGGLAHGDAASRTAVRSFLKTYRNKAESESIPDALLRAAKAANSDVFTLSSSLAQAGEMGTTLAAAVLQEDQLYWLSAGDSGLFLYRDGELTQLNVPHVYARQLDAKAVRGELTREAALGDPQREALTSYLGLPEIAEIDVTGNGFPLGKDDLVLLASDGLFKSLPPRDIAALLGDSGASDLQGLCERLIETTLARQRRGQDNVTVIGLASETWKPAFNAASHNGINRLDEARTAFESSKQDKSIRDQQARNAAQAGYTQAPPPPSSSKQKIVLPLFIAAGLAAAAFFGWQTCCAEPPNPRQPNPPIEQPISSGEFDPNKRPRELEDRPKDEPPRPLPSIPEPAPRQETPIPPAAGPKADVIAQSVVRVSRGQSTGLGFFLGRTHVLTSASVCCLPDVSKDTAYQVRTQGGTVLFGKPVVVDRKAGFAILQVPESPDAIPLHLSAETPAAGAPVWSFSVNGALNPGQVKTVAGPNLNHTAPIDASAEGGPLLDPCGAVLGMNRVINPASPSLSNESRSLRIGEAVKDLKKSKIPHQTASGKCVGGELK